MLGKGKIRLFLTGLVAAALLAAGCGGSGADKKSADSGKPIKIGATAGPHADVVHAVAEEAKKQGLKWKWWNSPITSLRTKPWQKGTWI